MGFPFDYRGIVRGNGNNSQDDSWFKERFLVKAKEKFETAKADIDLNENSLSFRTTARAFPYWFNKDAAALAHIPKGTIYFEPSDRKIHYILNFRKSVAIYSIGLLGMFGSLFIFVVNGPLLIRLVIVLFAWLLVMLVMFGGGIFGFKQFLNRLLREL